MSCMDSTVTSALMHEPSDSSLLWDVRVMVRLLKQADALIGGAVRRPPIPINPKSFKRDTH